jgi:hypothetical protein
VRTTKSGYAIDARHLIWPIEGNSFSQVRSSFADSDHSDDDVLGSAGLAVIFRL